MDYQPNSQAGIRVLALVPSIYDTSPGQRFRIEQWARCLEKQGFHFTFAPFENHHLHRVIYQQGQFAKKLIFILSAFLRRTVLLSSVHRYDLVFLHREAAIVGPPVFEKYLARQGAPLVYDFDDPIWLPYVSPTNAFWSRLKWHSKTADICRHSRRVVVGNRLLASWARQYSEHVHIVPSTIALDTYPFIEPNGPANSTITLGWTGSHSTLPFLQMLDEPLHQLASRRPFRLCVISHTDSLDLEYGQTELVAKKWNAATEAADLQSIDIGLAPFPNIGWTPWRCHGKVLQYMAAGIPTVASPVGIISDYIVDGVNGFLAETKDEWVAKLAELAHYPSLRRELGTAARRTIEESYSADVWVPRMRELFESVL